MPFSEPKNALPEPAPRQHLRARLVSRREVAPHHFQFELNCPPIAQRAIPGQFVHILPGVRSFEGSFDPLLRRAFSIMKVEGDNFTVLFRAMGRGTNLLATRSEGEEVDLLGPLGLGFDLTPFHVKQNVPAILVGGGVGVPPMVFLGSTLRRMGAQPSMILGARGAKDIVGEMDFAAQGTPVLLRTEDGSRGKKGRVTDEVESLLHRYEGEETFVFACGPFPMLRAVALLCEKYSVRAQVSLEENMPCGIGVCNGCVIAVKTRANGPLSEYEKYRRVCVEGPVCRAEEIEWN